MTWQLLDVSVPWLRILCLHQDGCVSTTGPLLHIARVLLSTLTIWMKMKPSSKSSQKKIAAKRYRDPKMYQVTSSDSSVVHDAATCLVTTVISLLIGALSVCGCSSFHFQCLNLPFGRKRDGEKIFKRFFSQYFLPSWTTCDDNKVCVWAYKLLRHWHPIRMTATIYKDQPTYLPFHGRDQFSQDGDPRGTAQYITYFVSRVACCLFRKDSLIYDLITSNHHLDELSASFIPSKCCIFCSWPGLVATNSELDATVVRYLLALHHISNIMSIHQSTWR